MIKLSIPCPQCQIRESKGLTPLLQKDKTIKWELDLCSVCEEELYEDWV